VYAPIHADPLKVMPVTRQDFPFGTVRSKPYPLIIVTFIPAPWIVMPFDVVIAPDHVQFPAGIVIVSPSIAEAIAVVTAVFEHEDAAMVAAPACGAVDSSKRKPAIETYMLGLIAFPPIQYLQLTQLLHEDSSRTIRSSPRFHSHDKYPYYISTF
jgi:hypothetical protein